MIEKALKNTQRTLKTTKKLNEILTALSSKGILRDFECKNGKCCCSVIRIIRRCAIFFQSFKGRRNMIWLCGDTH